MAVMSPVAIDCPKATPLSSARSLALLVWPPPVLRARTLGMIETVPGIVFVLITALAWRN